MHAVAKPAMLLSAMMAGGIASAEVFSVEGLLESVNTSTGRIVCNGVEISLGPATEYSSTGGVISYQQFTDTTPLPASPLPAAAGSAFVGGTCIVDGEDDLSGNVAGRVAARVFAEVRESVLVGPVTRLVRDGAAADFAILGVEVVLQTDSRVAAQPVRPINGLGYVVDLKTVPLGDLSSAEGYVGSDGRFHAYAIETSGGDPLDKPASPDTRISRGQVGFVSNTTVKLEIRGSCSWTTPNPSGAVRTQPVLVTVDGVVNGSPVFINPSTRAVVTDTTAANSQNVNCTEDPASPGFGEFRYRLDRYATVGAVPTVTRARVAKSANEPPAYPWSPTFVLDRAGFR